MFLKVKHLIRSKTNFFNAYSYLIDFIKKDFDFGVSFKYQMNFKQLNL